MIKYCAWSSRAATLAILQLCPVANITQWFNPKDNVTLLAIMIFFSVWVVLDISHTSTLSNTPPQRSAALVLLFLEGSYNLRRMHKTCPLSNKFFSKQLFLHSPIWMFATLHKCSFEREFYALQCDMHNSKFVFPTIWGLLLENDLYIMLV